MYAQANGIKMHYLVDGPEDAPWVTFVTGIANDTTLWAGQAKALSDKFRVLRYDLRGQGLTESTPPPYSIESLSSDLVALWDAIGVAKSHLVGLGLGSTIAMRTAIDKPQRIDKLAPTCTRARMVPDFKVMWGKLTETVTAGGVEAIVEQTAQRWFTEDFKAAHPDVIDNVRKMVAGTSRDGYLGCVSAFVGLDLEDELPRISARTLFMGGADDKSGGPEAIMRTLAEKVPDGVYKPVANAAHIANVQNEAEYNRILREFLLA
ncbi:MAG: 3-oxoadipate enol-lactonase [Betaproteobacteria bacterium]|nr:3-oxoadipate enol-lactonase [Betaproteobacteria bacterium]